MNPSTKRTRRSILIIAVIAVVGVALWFGNTMIPEQPFSLTNGAYTMATIPVEGMSCMACAASVRKAVVSIDGVDEAKVDLEHRKIIVQYIPEKVTPAQIAAAIEKLGYRAGEPIPESK